MEFGHIVLHHGRDLQQIGAIFKSDKDVGIRAGFNGLSRSDKERKMGWQLNSLSGRPPHSSLAREYPALHSLLKWIFAFALLATGTALATGWGFKIRDTVEDTGSEIVKVFPNTPAAAGLRPGDIIVEAAGRRINRAGDVYEAIGTDYSYGQVAVLRVLRDGSEKKIKLRAPDPSVEAQSDAASQEPSDRSMTEELFGGQAATASKAKSEKRPRSSWSNEADRSLTNEIFGGASSHPGNAKSSQAGAARTALGEEVTNLPPLPPQQPGETREQAAIMVGDMLTKAANASSAIGDGLREMLITALHNSGRFIVVERMDLQTLAAEQALSRSRMASPGAAIPEARMDVAEVMIVGAVTEFEPEAGGGGINLGITKLPFSFGRQTSNAHMAIDIRVVDIASGRVLGAKRIKGEASSSKTNVGLSPKTHGGGRIPINLGNFVNTPMEAAIRGCIEQSIDYIANTVPRKYYRVQ